MQYQNNLLELTYLPWDTLVLTNIIGNNISAQYMLLVMTNGRERWDENSCETFCLSQTLKRVSSVPSAW